jgi:hypothetical protein
MVNSIVELRALNGTPSNLILTAGASLVRKNAEPAVAASFLFCSRQCAAHSAAQVHLTPAGR